MKRHLPFVLSVLAVWILLLIIGKLRASGETPMLVQNSGSDILCSYTLSPELAASMPEDEDLSEWMTAQGFSVDPGTLTIFSSKRIVFIGAEADFHERWVHWLNTEWGPEHWRYTTEETLNLGFRVQGRTYGCLEVLWNTTPASGEVGPPRPVTMVFYGFDSPASSFYESELITLTATATYFRGHAWILLLCLSAFVAFFFYVLRRPIWRALTFKQRRTSPPADKS